MASSIAMMNLRNSFIVCLLVGVLACGCSRHDDGEAMYNEVKSVDTLVLASMSISKVGSLSSTAWWKIGDRVGVYSYDTYLRAYIDLSELTRDDLKWDDGHKRVHLTLPPVRTEFAGRDAGMREEHYRVSGFRSHIDAKERAEIKERMNTHLREEVENNSQFREMLTEKAEKKARAYFEMLFKANGYDADIDFRTL